MNRKNAVIRVNVLYFFVAIIVFSPVLAAQSNVYFDPSKHLDGYEEASFSLYKDVYDFEPFEALKGESISQERLRGLQDEWRKERERAEILIEKIEKDPVEKTVRLIHKKTRPYVYFSQINWSSHKELSPVVLNIQSLEKPRAGYESMIVNRFKAPVNQLVQSFTKEILAPMDLSLREGHEAFVVFILRSPGDYNNYYRTGVAKGYSMVSAYYESPLRSGVTFIDRLNTKEDKEYGEARRVLFSVAFSMLHGHKRTTKAPEDGLWAYAGLSELYSRCVTEGLSTTSLPLSNTGRTYLSNIIKDSKQRELYFLPIETLISVKDQSMLFTRLAGLASQLNKEKYSWQWRSMIVFEKQSALFTHFLRFGAKQKYLEGYNRYLKSLLLEEGQKEAFNALFSKNTLKKMKEEFANHILREFKSKDPRFILSSKDMADLMKPPPDPKNPMSLENNALGAGAKKSGKIAVQPSYDPGDLIVEGMTLDTVLSVALNKASNGALDGALAMVETILSSRDTKPNLKEIVTKEKKRFKALTKLRTDFLNYLKAGKKSVSFDYQGKRTKGVLKEFDGVKAVFKLPKNKEAILPFEDLTPGWLERAIREKRYKEAPDWLIAYAGLLSDSKNWKRRLKKGGADAEAIGKDAPDIQARLKEGELVYVLNDFSTSPSPANEIEADLCLKRIMKLFKHFKRAPLLKKKEKALKRMAAYCYGKIFDAMDKGEVLTFKGDFKIKDNNRVRLSYDFSDPAQIEDFEAINYMENYRKNCHEVDTSRDDSYFEIEDKGLSFSGQGCHCLKIGLKAPIKVFYDYKVTTRGHETADALPYIFFRVGVCDDGFGNCVLAGHDGSLRAVHKPSSLFEEAYDEDGFSLISDTVFHFEFVVEDREAHIYMDGEHLRFVKSGPLTGGRVFMWFHSDTHHVITKLSFEGQLDDGFLLEKRAEWVKEKMAAFPKL